jgi:hypothetical protein
MVVTSSMLSRLDTARIGCRKYVVFVIIVYCTTRIKNNIGNG